MVDQRPVLHLDDVLRAAAPQLHVLATGRDEHASVDDTVAVAGLQHLEFQQLVQPRRVGGREPLGHVLHHDDAGAGAVELAQHHFGGLNSAGGYADGHHPVGGLGHRACGSR